MPTPKIGKSKVASRGTFLIAMEWERHWAGIKRGVLEDTKTLLPGTSARFLASIKEFLGRCRDKIVVNPGSEEYMEGDKHPMEEAIRLGIKNKELNIVNKVRIYMQVTTIEIVNAKGTHINREWYGKGKKTLKKQKRMAGRRRTNK
jgi:hypothetical protein